MPIVLAIEPDLRQAAIIKRIVRDKIHADVVVVDSRDAALDAIRTSIPDVLLLSALLSPRDEDELIAHLRLLDGAEHLQTHTIPQLAGTSADREAGRGRGLLGMFSRKKESEPAAASGCDPDLFAEEIRTYLQHAHEKKEERRLLAEQGIEIETPGSVAQAAAAAASAAADAAPAPETAASSWADPFAWRPASSKKSVEPRVTSHESIVASPESVVASQESSVASREPVILNPEPVVASQESVVPSSEPVIEHYESVLKPAPAETTPAPVIINPEPMITPPAQAADPWAVDYSRREIGADAEPSMVGYTAPFSTPPAEPISLVDSAAPAFQPSVEEPAIASYDETSRAAQELDLRLDEGSTAPSVSDDLRIDAEPVHEFSARDARVDESEDVAEPEIEEEPVLVAPRRSPRSRRAARASLLRLMPLAIWARAEIDKHPRRGAAVIETPERSVSDELRDLMSRLAVPPNVAGVTYPRGCRIRRVRVLGGREARQGEAPGPVILSKRALEERRSRTNT